MPLWLWLAMTAFFLFGAVALWIVSIHYTKTHGKRPNRNTIALLISIVALVFLTLTVVHGIRGLRHGAYQIKGTVPEYLEHIETSPIEDRLPDDVTNHIVYYYRFDCSDCSTLFEQMKAAEEIMEQTCMTNVYWVSTRSSQGKKLMKDYPCDSVPSILYIRPSDIETKQPFFVEDLIDTFDSSKINVKALDNITEAWEADHKK